jgi:hypothetical protein
VTQYIAIDQTEGTVAEALPHAAQQEIRHSPLFYWWPAWAFGFVLPLLNAGPEKILATAPEAEPSPVLNPNKRREIVEHDSQGPVAELKSANAYKELAEQQRQRLVAELETAQARERSAKELAERDSQRQAAELKAATTRMELADQERQRLAAALEAAQARTEIVERDNQRLAAALEAAQAREKSAKEMAEAARDREQGVIEIAEAARARELAANAMVEGTRRVARQTSAWLIAALLLALIAFTTGIYSFLKLAQLKNHQSSINAMAVATSDRLRATTTRTTSPRTHPGIAVHVR